ncbi:putative transcription factor C2H2 family [Helianthus annuus]|nr:putative transcription factor C2H2 family [Helianthus annuus]
MSYTVCHQAQLFFSSLHHPQSKLGFTSITNFTTQAPLMADIPNQQSPPPQSTTSQNHTLEQNQQISPPQTLDDSYTNSSSFTEEDDLINVDDADVPYTFVVDPFSPLDSSIFASSSSYLNNRNQQVNLNSCYRCLSESESDLESDCADSTVYPDCLYGRDDEYEYDQMDFVTDLFDSRGEIERVDVGVSEINDHDDDEFVSNNNIEELGLGLEGGGGGGLRVARIESDSDIEDLGAADDDQNDDRIETSELSFDSARVEERDGLSSVIERIEEISVSSDISSEGDASVGVLEWEILLAVNNFERGLEFATEGGEEGFVYTPEFDTLIGQFVESVRALRGSPPAAKSFIDNLPLVTLKKGDLNDDDTVICAVCKDEILMEERVTQLPCKHHYHGECIVPWLSIRNTCPVCRFELPTDDVEYERSKNRVDDDDGDGELRVGYGFDISP